MAWVHPDLAPWRQKLQFYARITVSLGVAATLLWLVSTKAAAAWYVQLLCVAVASAAALATLGILASVACYVYTESVCSGDVPKQLWWATEDDGSSRRYLTDYVDEATGECTTVILVDQPKKTVFYNIMVEDDIDRMVKNGNSTLKILAGSGDNVTVAPNELVRAQLTTGAKVVYYYVGGDISRTSWFIALRTMQSLPKSQWYIERWPEGARVAMPLKSRACKCTYMRLENLDLESGFRLCRHCSERLPPDMDKTRAILMAGRGKE